MVSSELCLFTTAGNDVTAFCSATHDPWRLTVNIVPIESVPVGQEAYENIPLVQLYRCVWNYVSVFRI
jgi:hypothetical protein